MNQQITNINQRTNGCISTEEYNRHINTLSRFNTIKNSLLTFSFTAVLTLLGIVIASNGQISPLVCLIPYFLIIPFSARIAYYRLASAHINTFLKVFEPKKMIFENGTPDVPEKQGKIFPVIAWLINHEMVVLAIATGLIYCYQYYNYATLCTWVDILLFLPPLPFVIAVFVISNSTYSYKDLCEGYKPKWEAYLEKWKEAK